MRVHRIRQIQGYLGDKEMTHKLVNEVAPRYEDRNGGYLRILKLGPRQGDNATHGAHRAGVGRCVWSLRTPYGSSGSIHISSVGWERDQAPHLDHLLRPLRLFGARRERCHDLCTTISTSSVISRW
jgi:hypothetical protein